MTRRAATNNKNAPHRLMPTFDIPVRRERERSPTMIQLGRRLLLGLGAAALVVIALWLALSWQTVKHTELERLGKTAALLAAYGDSYLEHVESDLRNLVDALHRADPLRAPEKARRRLDDFMADHGRQLGFADYAVIRPDGQVVLAGSLKPGARAPDLLAGPDGRADFERDLHRRGLGIDRPRRRGTGQEWAIPLRYAVIGEDQRPRFVLHMSLRMDEHQMHWQGLRADQDLVIGLLREDGQLLSHHPNSPGSDLYDEPPLRDALYLATHTNPASGTYEDTMGDGATRYGAYRRLARHPVHAFVSLPASSFVGVWWQSVQTPLYLIAGFFLAGLLVFQVNARRFASRMAAIRAALARATAASPALPVSGVREIDTLCGALADARTKLQEAMRNRERLLLSAARAGTYSVRASDGLVAAADARFLEMLGLPESEVVGRPWASLLADPASANSPEGAAHTGAGLFYRVARFRDRPGAQLWLSLAEYEEPVGEDVLRHGLAIDVSEREQLLDRLTTQTGRLQALWHAATRQTQTHRDGMTDMLERACMALDMECATVNELAGEELVVRHATAGSPGLAVGTRFSLRDTLCKFAIRQGDGLLVADLTAEPLFREHPVVTELGMRAFVSVPVTLGQHAFYGTLTFMRHRPWPGDFTHDDRLFLELLALWFGQVLMAKQQREALEQMAMSDALTRLPNRRAAENRLQEELARARRGGPPFALALCDLDRFKLINDHYGHAVGDEVLAKVTEIMRQTLRETDWLARWGGEEFLVFLHGSDSTAARDAMERLRQTLKSQPIETAQGSIEVTTSVGVGVLRSGEQKLTEVLAEADNCVYEAKHRGRDCVVLGDETRAGTLWKAGQLQRALREQRIIASYQPIVELKTGTVVADEALACLLRSDGSVLPAAEFIEAAEGLNLIHQVDGAIARQTMSRCTHHVQAGTHPNGMVHFINISPQFLARRELVEGLLADAMHFCTSCNVDFGPVKPVVFEITERDLLTDFRVIRRDLQPLIDFGFRIALDDFGSGYSSFLYLAELPVSFLKIEGWMVQNMDGNPKVRQLVQSLIDLAQRLGITTIAEWVEDQKTMEQLRDMGVDWAQGYHFGRPAFPDEASQLPLALVR